MRSSLRFVLGTLSLIALCTLPLRAVAQDTAAGTTTGTTTSEPESSNPALTGRVALGGTLGAGVLGSGGGAHVNYGLSFDGRFLPEYQNVTLGVFFNHVSRGSVLASEDPSGIAIDSNLNFYGIQGDYYISSILPGAHIGAKLALGNNSVTANGVSNSSTDLYIGPKVAYEVGVTNQVSAGFEGSILLSAASDSRTTTNVLATLKYWLG